MLTAVHYVLMAWYFTGPLIALGVALWLARRVGRRTPVVSWGVTILSATALGTGLATVYATAVDGQLRVGQAVLATYFAAGMLFLLKAVDFGLRRLTRVPAHAAATHAGTDAPEPVPAARLTFRHQFGFLIRVVVLFGIGLPYVMAAVMTYRPKATLTQTPTTDYQEVVFTATDGTRLSGWWIPALRAPEGAPDTWGRRTLLVCHGLAANKANHLVMGQWGPSRGFNVFVFDFRAHGHSGGQLTTFGDRERHDVLGAVRFLKAHHTDEAREIVGIGASMGAAALLTAAGEDSAEGQAIDRVVVYGTYARLGDLARSVADRHFVRPVNLLVRYLAVPMACAQVNSDLPGFRPADAAARLWPRPVLIIHGLRDEIIPFEQGEWLHDAASQPRTFHPVTQAGHNEIIEDPSVREAVQRFAEHAERVPVL